MSARLLAGAAKATEAARHDWKNLDAIRTIMHYYADPAQPNIENIRVTDLI